MTKIGKIISVEYDKFRVRLFQATKNSTITIEGKVYYFGNIGSYLKTINSSGEYVLCEVISIFDWIGDKNANYGEFNLDSSREIIMKPIGTLTDHEFNMGVGVFPSLYSDVEIVTYHDLDNILSSDSKYDDPKVHTSLNLGLSKSLINYNILIDIDKLFNIHTAVLGNTGSGKSNTIAHILQDIYRQKDYSAIGAKTIIFDANGEYPKAFSAESELNENISTIFYKPNIPVDSKKKTDSSTKDNGESSEPLVSNTVPESSDAPKKIDAGIKFRPFYLPYYLMNLDEWLAFLMASERTQKPFWDRVLQECYKFYRIFSNSNSTSATSETSDTEQKKFCNYIKWKLHRILTNILQQTDSDTVKMTSAKGAISKIRGIFDDKISKGVTDPYIQDLLNYLNICDKISKIYYGNNDGALSDGLNLSLINDKTTEQYLSFRIDSITKVGKPKLITHYEEGATCLIDTESAYKVNEEKLSSGQYFDHNFLENAVEIVLMEEESRGNLHIREFVSTLMSRLDFFLHSPECDFMRCTDIIFKDSEDYMNQMFNIPSSKGSIRDAGKKTSSGKENDAASTGNKNDNNHQLFTIDSSEVGTETLELMTSVLSRMIFDNRKRLEGDDRTKNPIHLILDEAHRYIHKNTEYILRENIFERIAREGRKYSLYLIISSQRPSELSPTVLSQCGNYIVHRVQNEVDMKYIYSVLPYFSEDYITKIKQAVPGEALVFGRCVPMPLMVKVIEANPAPNSSNCKIPEEWFKEVVKTPKVEGEGNEAKK